MSVNSSKQIKNVLKILSCVLKMVQPYKQPVKMSYIYMIICFRVTKKTKIDFVEN